MHLDIDIVTKEALQAGYFGLYVDSTFERGMSRPCSTYNNACLAADEVCI